VKRPPLGVASFFLLPNVKAHVDVREDQVMAERNDRGGARSGRPSGDGRSGSSRPSSGGNRSGSGHPSSGGSGRPSSGGSGRPSGGRPGSDRSSSDRPRSSSPRDSGSRDSGSRDSRSSAPRSGGYDRAPRRDDRDDRPRSGGAPRTGGYDRAPRRDDRGPVSRSNDRRDERGRPDGQRSDNRNTSGRPSNNRRDDRGQHEQVNRRDAGYEIRDPRIPDDITPEDFDKGMSQELRSLPEGLQILVARHLVAAERAMAEEDFDLATEHVRAARRRASRISMVREACGIVAYKSGRFGEALTELRAVRRMAGGDQYIPMIADCERGLGKPQKALDYIRTIDTTKMLAETRAEMMIVAAGARGDLGELDAAIVTLQIPELTRLNPGDTRARLQYAYAMLLKDAGRANEAREWMERAAGSDIDGATDAEEQCSLMDGIEFSEED